MKKNINFLTVISLITMLFISAGCSNKSSATNNDSNSKDISLNVAMEEHTAVTELKKLLPEFEEETGIKVNFEVLPQDEMNNKVALALSSDSDQYDVAMLDHMYLPEYARADWIESLDDYIDEDDIDEDDFMEGFLESLKTNDTLYGLPFYGESTMLMYNKKMFDEAGIDHAPTTFKELELAAEKLTKDNQYGITMRGGRDAGGNVYVWSGFYNALGGEWDSSGKPIISSGTGEKSLEFYAKLLNDFGPPGGANFTWDQVQLSLQQGTTAMTIDATNFATRLEDPENSNVVGDIGYAPLPEGPEGNSPSTATHGLIIPKSAKHKDASYKFISWATSADIQLRTSIEGDRGDATRKSVWESDEFLEKYNYDDGNWSKTVINSMDSSDPEYRPRVPEWNEVMDQLGVAISDVLDGKDASSVVEKTQKSVDEIFE